MSETLFVEERRRVILDRLKQNGRVSVKALSDEMAVSAVTIRQDLRVLEEDGLLERTYGGAVRKTPKQSGALPEPPFNIRNTENLYEKTSIAATAARMVRDGDAVALDASTTAYALVPYLQKHKKLTIITNSLMIAQSFPNNPGIEVLIPGGRLRKDSMSLVGRPDGLPNINLNIGFFGARGLSLQSGMSDTDSEEVAMKRAMIVQCITTVLLIDSSKWGQVAPYTVMSSTQIQHVITSQRAPKDIIAQFRQQKIRVDITDGDDRA